MLTAGGNLLATSLFGVTSAGKLFVAALTVTDPSIAYSIKHNGVVEIVVCVPSAVRHDDAARTRSSSGLLLFYLRNNSGTFMLGQNLGAWLTESKANSTLAPRARFY